MNNYLYRSKHSNTLTLLSNHAICTHFASGSNVGSQTPCSIESRKPISTATCPTIISLWKIFILFLYSCSKTPMFPLTFLNALLWEMKCPWISQCFCKMPKPTETQNTVRNKDKAFSLPSEIFHFSHTMSIRSAVIYLLSALI